MSKLFESNGINSGRISNSRVITMEPGEELPIRRASARDDSRVAGLTNLNFRNTHLSKTHAMLRWHESGQFQLMDQGSTFGTVINDDFLAPGHWFSIADGDRVGFIVAKPSAVIAEVIKKNERSIKIPLSDFNSNSLGLEFTVKIKQDVIRFVPIGDCDSNDQGECINDTVGDFTKDVTEIEDNEDNEDNGDVEVIVVDAFPEINKDDVEEAKAKDEEEEEEEEEEDESISYNGCCAGSAGSIQRYDPPSDSNVSIDSSTVSEPLTEATKESGTLADTVKSFVSKSRESLGFLADKFYSSESEKNREKEIVAKSSQKANIDFLAEHGLHESDFDSDISDSLLNVEGDSDLDQILSIKHSDSEESDFELNVDSQSSSSSSLLGSESDSSDSGSDSESENAHFVTNHLCQHLSEEEDDSSDAVIDSDFGETHVDIVGIEDGFYVGYEESSDQDTIDEDNTQDCWTTSCCRGTKRRFDDDDDYEVDEEYEPKHVEKKQKTEQSLAKTIAKEVGKGVFYVLATITALGVYGSKLNAQENR